MKRFFTTCLLMVAVHGLYAQAPKDVMLANWERAKIYTKEYLDAMPEDGYAYKPTPEVRSFAQQMDHIADANAAFIAAASGKKGPMEGSAEKMSDQSKAAVTKVVMDSYDFVINSLKDMSGADLDKTVKVFGMDMTAGTAFDKAFEHQTHHRGQATLYIRMKGIKPPQEKLF